jgi:hypothetical protein
MTLFSRLRVFAVVAVVALATAVAASALGTSGKAGAPGQVCKHLKVKGKKTGEQRAAFKHCIQDAVAERRADNAAKAGDKDEVAEPGKSGKAGAPGQVCKHLKVKGKKSGRQRAAFKRCIRDAVAER